MKASLRLMALLAALVFGCMNVRAEDLTLHTRKGGEQKVVKWDPKKTAIVICDMWNEHWCKGATERVGEIAPRMNEVVKKAREKGVFIIHAPSETMKFYEGTAARKRAQGAPKVTPKVPLQRWCKIDLTKESALPIDDSDGGCDDVPKCKGGPPYPWTRQIATIEIKDEDAITDSDEAYFLMEQRGIENVIVMGVHANMCVLGRPFSIRQMVAQGKNVLLMRDMTDTMYNSRMRPFVNHFRGTDLIVDHIEKFWAASITSTDFVGGEPFRFKGDTGKTASADKPAAGKKIVFMIGEPEYDTKTTLPEFAKTELEPLGFTTTFVIADKEKPNDFAGLEALKDADLLFVSVRRATPTKEQMALIRAHLNAGKPLVGIRTASHAFDAKPPDENHVAWATFDRDVLGAQYQNHYGKAAAVEVKATPEGARNSILAGVDVPFKSASSLYKSRNLFHTATALLNGQIEGQKEIEPVAWINSGYNRRVFYTSLGGQEDFKLAPFRALLRNGILWTLDLLIAGAEKKQAAIDQDQAGALTPAEAVKSFTVVDGLEFEQVLAEPIVAQPLQISWDERGRMWVVQYLQYPNPAGLKMLSRDNFWRAVYDKVPQPPPNHFRGLDKITIHEDTDGDGKYDTHKTFVDGLNIATSIALGRGGVWVLNPPYLLFYPDANHDDTADGPPTVHLAGFGLEDTHSVANSLRWGPDGWLYGCSGSTTTGSIIRPGLETTPVHFLGQLVWRYHPESKRFEIFAEGGGNAFGLEMDSQGRAFSGHNGGNTRGFYYPQGAYEQKGFEKHGPLSNPYAYGYFKPMGHPDVDRFTHTFIIYEADALPAQFQGKLFGVEPLQGRVVMSDVMAEGSTFKTRDIGYAVTSSDKWFRPVDIKQGPDGAIYVADWYDRQVNHYRNHEGQVDPGSGRIYRLKAKGSKSALPENLGRLSDDQLVQRLMSPNKWARQTVLRLMADRRASSVVPLLKTKATSTTGPRSVDFVWALDRVGGVSEDVGRGLLTHPEPAVREWVVRLMGDDGEVAPETATALANMAALEPDVHVRSQLASTARRLRAEDDLAIISRLAEHREDLKDPHIPLMVWWAVEAKVEKSADEVLHAFAEKAVWEKPLIKDGVLDKLMRRFAQAGARQDLLHAARLFELSPGSEFTTKLQNGFEDGLKGRPLNSMPAELIAAMKKAGVKNEILAMRLGDKEATKAAVQVLENPNADRKRRLRIMEALGDIDYAGADSVLADIATRLEDAELTKAALVALQRHNNNFVGGAITAYIPKMDADSQIAAMNLVVSRGESISPFLDALMSGAIDAKTVPADVVAKIRLRTPEKAQKIFGAEKKQTTGETQVEIDRVNKILASGSGSPYEGFKVFGAACGVCHRLFDQGGQIGPDLTAFKRDDLQNMLLNIVHPNAEIREGYVNYMVTTKDGRALTGFLADEDKQTVVIRGIDGANMTIARADIDEMKPTGFSLMPEGLLQSLEDQQIRDLFAYLRSTQPLVR
ncbi:MAG TPA: PVC-type heme-binding CxxCH protein [Verrucomicrobiae bacterium]|nr:PVC-type heme-binding CxxCH protein [Verrucomicrobiae bacterium]